MKRSLPIAILILAASPAIAWSHSFAIYVSTPLTPPATYEWTYVSLIFIAISLTLCHRFAAKRTLITSFLTAVATTLVFWVVFVYIGRFAASTSTAPPPGLGPPSAIYLRWRHDELGRLFAFWNAFGVVLLAAATFVVGRVWKLKTGRLALLAVPVIVYLSFLSPFLATGAIAHGWAGGYVMNAGEDQLYEINRACWLYAEENNGRFPIANDIDELLPKIETHISKPESRYGNPITVHPAAWAFEKDPKPFAWNEALSGRPAPKLPVWDVEQMPVKCPYLGARVRPIDELGEDQQQVR